VTPSTLNFAALPESLRLLYAPVLEDLGEVERILAAEMVSRDPFVDELVKYGFKLGGKRLRPALLLLSAKACGKITPEHRTLSAVVEMIHTATLVHDDVLDEADVRRHLATVNSRWGNEASVLLGDFLFTHAFYLASTLETTFACRVIGRATNIVCEGEIRQMGSCGVFSLAEEAYLEIIEAKTAELCACCCELGAHYAGVDQQLVARLARYGRYLGVAFQIADDLLDVVGEEKVAGKSLGTDLEKQKPTLPLIRTLQCANLKERQQLEAILNEDSSPQNGSASRARQLALWYDRFDAISYSREKAQSYADRAMEEISPLPESDAKQVLQQIAQFVVARSA